MTGATTPPVNPQVEALLAELRDIHLPDPGGVNIAPAWFLLAAGCLLAGSLLAIFWLRRKPHSDWRASAIDEVERIRERAGEVPGPATLAACSRLLRRAGLSLEPREQVAALTGTAWLSKLDHWHGSTEFTRGVGSLMLDAQYQPLDQHQARESKTGSSADETTLPPSSTMDPQINDLLRLVEDFIQHAGRR